MIKLMSPSGFDPVPGLTIVGGRDRDQNWNHTTAKSPSRGPHHAASLRPVPRICPDVRAEPDPHDLSSEEGGPHPHCSPFWDDADLDGPDPVTLRHAPCSAVG